MLFVFKGTNEVDPALYDNVTSSLKGMHSLKRFAVFRQSLEFPLTGSLLLGALRNRSTTEVYICDRYVGKCIQKLFDVCSTLYTISVMSPSTDGVHYSYHDNSDYI